MKKLLFYIAFLGIITSCTTNIPLPKENIEQSVIIENIKIIENFDIIKLKSDRSEYELKSNDNWESAILKNSKEEIHNLKSSFTRNGIKLDNDKISIHIKGNYGILEFPDKKLILLEIID